MKDCYRFYLSCAGFNLNDGWFLVVGSVFKKDPEGIIVIAANKGGNCTLDRIEREDSSTFKIFIKDISRENMNQEAKFRFHLIYPSNGKLLKQTLNYNGECNLSLPIEIES